MKRIITADLTEDDQELALEQRIRPDSFTHFFGQVKIKETLRVYIEAAKIRGEQLDHVLLYGPPGLGKTTLSNIIAKEMGTNMRTTSGPAIEKPGDMAALLNELSAGDILFIDEIHRMPRAVEEVLYSAMEDFFIDIMIGKGTGQGAKSIRLNLPPFTLVGATTRVGLLTAPLRDRFGVIAHMEMYNTQELAEIVVRSAGVLDVVITPQGAQQIAQRSRGTPRIANRLLRRVRDFATVANQGITDTLADHALNTLDVDKIGLDQMDRKLMDTLIHKFHGGPVGLDTLAISINEDPGALEDVYEPYLIQLGFIARTPRGRVVTAGGFSYFGVKPPTTRLIQPNQQLTFDN